MTAAGGIGKLRLPNPHNAYFGNTYKTSFFYAFNSVSSYGIIQIYGVTVLEELQL